MIKLLIPFLLLTSSILAQDTSGNGLKNFVVIKPADTQAEIVRKAASVVPSPRQLRWQQLELTAFFHFGINTFTNREWGDGKEDISRFNPVQLDAEQWIKTVQAAGFKQVIMVCKHHDGFCLWPSKYTEHSVKSTPWRNGAGDVVKEVSQACRKYGIGFGIYLSPWDRNAAFYGDTKLYNEYFINQLTELLTQYGKVDEVWFDGANGEGPNGKKPVYHFTDWYALIRKLQPAATIAIMGPDVRWVGTESGDGRLTEWSVVPADAQMQEAIAASSQTDLTFAPKGDMMGDDLGSRAKILQAKALVWYPAETDVSIRPGWFYHPAEDTMVKSPGTLLDIYYSSVGRNSQLLLNIPPDTSGLINSADSANLAGFKQLLDQTFKDNLAKGAIVKADNGTGYRYLFDGDNATAFTAADTAVSIDFTLRKSSAFNVLLLQENIRSGQRAEKFLLQYKAGKTWTTIAEGTTIGYKRLLRFPAVTARQVRLVIQASRLNVALAEFGLYNEKR